MPQLKVHVVSIDEQHFPVAVDFELVDVFGTTHKFTEKVPAIGIEIQKTPYFAWIDCTVSNEKGSSVMVSTHDPHGVECHNGNFEFEVPRTSLR